MTLALQLSFDIPVRGRLITVSLITKPLAAHLVADVTSREGYEITSTNNLRLGISWPFRENETVPISATGVRDLSQKP